MPYNLDGCCLDAVQNGDSVRLEVSLSGGTRIRISHDSHPATADLTVLVIKDPPAARQTEMRQLVGRANLGLNEHGTRVLAFALPLRVAGEILVEHVSAELLLDGHTIQALFHPVNLKTADWWMLDDDRLYRRATECTDVILKSS